VIYEQYFREIFFVVTVHFEAGRTLHIVLKTVVNLIKWAEQSTKFALACVMEAYIIKSILLLRSYDEMANCEKKSYNYYTIN